MLKSTLLAATLAVATTISSIAPAQAASAGRLVPPAIAGETSLVHEARHLRPRRRDFHGPYHRRILRPVQVRRILRNRGFRHIRFIDRSPPVYRVRARGWRGPVIVAVSARNGRIIGLRRARYH